MAESIADLNCPNLQKNLSILSPDHVCTFICHIVEFVLLIKILIFIINLEFFCLNSGWIGKNAGSKWTKPSLWWMAGTWGWWWGEIRILLSGILLFFWVSDFSIFICKLLEFTLKLNCRSNFFYLALCYFII